MARIVREMVGAAEGARTAVDDDDVATVVVVTVCVVVTDDGAGAAVCADKTAAVANRVKARNSFFTIVLDLGEIEIFLIFYMVRDWCRNAKDRKGGDFGNHASDCSDGSDPKCNPRKSARILSRRISLNVLAQSSF